MKKIALLAVAMVFVIYAGAQKKMISASQDALDKGELDKAWESIQTAKNSDETKDNPKTWFVMGEILQAVSKSTDSKYAAISENPVLDAYDSYQKALEIDPKKRYDTEINLKLPELSSLASNFALKAFDSKNYDKALVLFELILDIEKRPMYKGLIDTSMIFNCGLSAENAKKYDKAIEYFSKAASLKYGGGATYSWLRSAYMAKGDTLQATDVMQKAYEIYPNDLSVLVDLVNYYLTSGQVKQAFDYLNKAKEKDPNNSSFLFAEGTLYERMNNPDSAISSYKKAIDLNSNNYDAYYNLGALYYNQAVIINNKATEENDNNKYKDLIEQRNQEFEKGLPYMERAHEINPKAEDAAKSLKSFYVQLQMNDKLELLKKEMGW